MRVKILTVFLAVAAVLLSSCSKAELKTIPVETLEDKIRGGWAGKMIGVAYGGPTEFQYNSVINDDEIEWDPVSIKNSIGEDDLYVQLTFMMTMDEYGIDAPAEKFAQDFADAGYMLFHANRKGRKNVWDGVMPPMSGHPKYNLHADDIDFQIEADYIGFMCPGMPQTSNEICDKIGHIMNYGDGVYGGMFVSALYTAAYFENDIGKIVDSALRVLPKESKYAKCVQDVIDGHKRNPSNWRKTWHELQNRWGEVDVCGGLDPFNIDAKINGAYIVMGILYGDGDFEKTMEISTRCGQDSDCNPSNASGVLGILLGYNRIPEKWTKHIPEMADEEFIYTNYTFNKAVDRTLHYAKKLIVENGGRIEDGMCHIKIQPPEPAKLEQSFVSLKAKSRATIDDEEHWRWKGNWRNVKHSQWGDTEVQRIADEKGAEFTFTFEGTGAVIMGRWDRDCGKADVYVDGQFVREVDNYYWVMERGAGFDWLNGAHLFHVLDLKPGKHTIRMVVNGEKNPKATGTKLKVSRAIVYEGN